MPKLSEQTKVTRALLFGLLPDAHPDELRVLMFLSQQHPPTATSTGYKWMTGGRFMSQTRWAEEVLGMDKWRLMRALDRLRANELVETVGEAHNGRHPVEHRLTDGLVQAAVDWFDHLWVEGRLSKAIAAGGSARQEYEDATGIAKVQLEPRGPKPRPRSPSQKAAIRWALE